MKKILKVDMDGCIAVWNEKASFEEVAEEGYFRNRIPQTNLLEALKILMKKGIDIRICSAAYQDGHSEADKRYWLKKHFIELPEEAIEIVPYGTKKPGGENVFLIDDYTKNLKEFEGIGIKFLNQINNNSFGSWDGYVISYTQSAKSLANQIEAIMIMEG